MGEVPMTGADSRAAAPSGVVTFLFTDIEGSTKRWETDPAAMRSALAVHDDVLSAAITANGGRLFKHTGDGVCAAFTSPHAAVDAAVAAQRLLALPVRMGIATGEAELRGGDYFGAVLNRASRIMAAGHGGQILLDGITADLLTGVELTSLGSRRLRDIAKAVDVFQIRADGLPTEFPPLKTEDATPGNLRPRSTPLIGREAELAGLTDALKTHRLITLTGVGGVGKTRLALGAGARLAGDLPDGVWVIELAAVGDPAAVPDAVGSVLGIVQQPGMSLTGSIALALRGRLRLLIFDNCEHVLDAAAEVVESILATSETIKILATSREGLRIDDERLWQVPPLDTKGGAESAAACLFVDRARAIARDDSLAPPSAVTEICQRLDGILLAIELAASRLLSMSVTEIRDRINDRFRLLVGSRRGLERHQTLRHAVQWSHDLLDDTEKDLLARCSVFAGGFDLDEACAIAGSDDAFATLDVLDSLVRKSLLVANRTFERTRFSMLETIRQFAEEQLIASGHADDVRAEHARYFARCECDVFALWDGPRQREAYAWVAREMANLRSAFRWSADHDDLDTATCIAHYATFVGFWGEQQEPVRWTEELIEPARAAGHRRLAQLYAMAALCFTAGRIDESTRYAEAGQQAILSGRFDDVRKEAEASIGSAYGAIGQAQRWVDWCRDVIARRPATYIHAQAVLAIALKMAGADDESSAAGEPLLAVADSTDNPNLAAWALFGYGTAKREVAPAAAYEALRRGLKIAQDSGSRQTECSIALMLSPLAIAHNDIADGLDYITQSTRYYHDTGHVYLVRSPLAVLAVLLDRLGRYELAATVCGFTVTPFVRASLPEIDTTVAHLQDVLGIDAYESAARTGELMATPEVVAYAFEQMDRLRAELT
jgi:predicted ATPase/class 3 adenylate cyclase